MGIARGLNTVKDGLVFGYDDCYNGSGEQMASGRYFKGPAHTNLLEDIDPSYTNSTNANFSAVSGEEVVDIPIVGKRTVKYVDYFNNYPTGGTCCPNLFHYHGNDGQIPVDGSTSYTYSIIYKHSNNYTHPNFMYRYEYRSDSTYNTEGGFHNTASDRRTHLGNGWYHAWGSFTTQSTTSYVVCYSFLYNYGTATYRYSVAAISLVKNETGQTHFIIPPQLMLDPLGSVSNTTSLIDLKKTTDIDVSNVSFNSTGQPTFDGTDDTITFDPGTFPTSWQQPFSVEAVVYIPSGATWYNQGSGTAIIGRGSYTGSWGLFRGGTDNSVYFYMRTGSNTFNPGGTIGRDKFYHIVGTWDGTSQAIFYINGSQNSQETSTSVGTTVDNTGNISVGGNIAFGGSNGGYGEGTFPVVKLYSKKLTATEIQQNYKAYKNRFNI
jgi:hypothetical protein